MDRLVSLLEEALKVAVASSPFSKESNIDLEKVKVTKRSRHRNPEHGDFQSTISLQLAPKLLSDGQTIHECAQIVSETLLKELSLEATGLDTVVSVSARDGFINFTLKNPEDFISDCPRSSTIDEQKELPYQTFTVSSIGIFESVFGEKHGTPRQGAIAPSTRGRLTLRSDISDVSLEGLKGYSHVWLVFMFHKNSQSIFKPKVRPPRLNGDRVGVFATRSPHRVNDIGMSVVKLDKIDGSTLHFSGIDLIDQTPILDIKPYHPADAITDFRIPEWVETKATTPLRVEFTQVAEQQLQECITKLKFYDEFEDIKNSITECLELDPRTVHSKSKHGTGGLYGFRLDRIDVVFRIHEDAGDDPDTQQTIAQVVKIVFYADGEERPQLRTKKWFEALKSEIKE